MKKPCELQVCLGITADQEAALWPEISQDPLGKYFKGEAFPVTLEGFREYNRGTVLVATMDGELVGALWMCDEHEHPVTHEPTYCFVGLMYIIQRFRGRHGGMIGAAFVRCMLDVMGYKNIYATVHHEHLACQEYMLRLGLTRVGILPGRGLFDGQASDLYLFSWLKPQKVSHG